MIQHTALAVFCQNAIINKVIGGNLPSFQPIASKPHILPDRLQKMVTLKADYGVRLLLPKASAMSEMTESRIFFWALSVRLHIKCKFVVSLDVFEQSFD